MGVVGETWGCLNDEFVFGRIVRIDWGFSGVLGRFLAAKLDFLNVLVFSFFFFFRILSNIVKIYWLCLLQFLMGILYWKIFRRKVEMLKETCYFFLLLYFMVIYWFYLFYSLMLGEIFLLKKLCCLSDWSIMAFSLIFLLLFLFFFIFLHFFFKKIYSRVIKSNGSIDLSSLNFHHWTIRDDYVRRMREEISSMIKKNWVIHRFLNKILKYSNMYEKIWWMQDQISLESHRCIQRIWDYSYL